MEAKALLAEVAVDAAEEDASAILAIRGNIAMKISTIAETIPASMEELALISSTRFSASAEKDGAAIFAIKVCNVDYFYNYLRTRSKNYSKNYYDVIVLWYQIVALGHLRK